MQLSYNNLVKFLPKRCNKKERCSRLKCCNDLNDANRSIFFEYNVPFFLPL